jgi:hypothetical protein
LRLLGILILRLPGCLAGRFLLEPHLRLAFCAQNLDLRILHLVLNLRLLSLLHLHLRLLRPLDDDLRLRHAHGDLRLRQLDRDPWRRLMHHDLWLSLFHRHLWRLLLDYNLRLLGRLALRLWLLGLLARRLLLGHLVAGLLLLRLLGCLLVGGLRSRLLSRLLIPRRLLSRLLVARLLLSLLVLLLLLLRHARGLAFFFRHATIRARLIRFLKLRELLELLLGRRKNDPQIAILLLGELQFFEVDGDVPLAKPKDTANADDDGGDIAILIEQKIVDVADAFGVFARTRIDRLSDQIVQQDFTRLLRLPRIGVGWLRLLLLCLRLRLLGGLLLRKRAGRNQGKHRGARHQSADHTNFLPSGVEWAAPLGPRRVTPSLLMISAGNWFLLFSFRK